MTQWPPNRPRYYDWPPAVADLARRVDRLADLILILGEQVMSDQDRLDAIVADERADTAALGDKLSALTDEIKALKDQPAAESLDFSGLDAVAADLDSLAKPAAEVPPPVAVPPTEAGPTEGNPTGNPDGNIPPVVLDPEPGDPNPPAAGGDPIPAPEPDPSPAPVDTTPVDPTTPVESVPPVVAPGDVPVTDPGAPTEL